MEYRLKPPCGVGTPQKYQRRLKTERVNGVLGDTLRTFADCVKDDWDSLLPYVDFAINNLASTLVAN